MSLTIHPYHDADDVIIDRESNQDWAILRDEEGTQLFTFSADMTDQQILQALRFASSAYRDGQEIGSETRAMQIRAALGVPHPDK